MNRPKVVITGKVQPIALEMMREACDVVSWDSVQPIPKETLYEWIKDAHGLFCSGSIRVDEALLEHAKQLRVICQSSVGYDNVDVDACTAHGIPFGNTPDVLTEATADLTFGLLLSAARRIHEGYNQVKAGEWVNNFEIPFGSDLYGKNLGIVGMGSIGAAVARRAQGFGMRVLYYNRRPRQDDEVTKATYASFDDVLAESDFLVVLVPLSTSSRNMFGPEQFRRMKSTAYFINVARGLVVDTMALYEALKNGEIHYAAVDVTHPEPLPGNHPLLQLQNFLVTPHVGSATHETRDRMAELTVRNLLAGLNRQPLTTCVNLSVNYP